MIKRILQFFVCCFFFIFCMGCQVSQRSSSMLLGTPTIRSVATNYFIVHGMCIGYLQGTPVSEEQFHMLSELDKQAKLQVIRALSVPSSQNIKQAQQSLNQIIYFININQRNIFE